MNPLFYRANNMMTDCEARVAMREIISRHLEEGVPKRIHLEKLLDDPKRSIPIRGALESFPKKISTFTPKKSYKPYKNFCIYTDSATYLL